MELSITLTELALIFWAAIATAFAAKYYEEAKHTKLLLTIFIEDEKARAQILRAKADFDKRMKGESHD